MPNSSDINPSSYINKYILVFNCGSSSIKFTIIDIKSEEAVISGIVESINSGQPFISIKHKNNKLADKEKLSTDGYNYAMEVIFDRLGSIDDYFNNIIAVGHRVVHGGEIFTDSVLITAEIVKHIEKCSDLAPLHNPANLMGIEIAQKYLNNMPHVACFDTAFHQTMPETSYIYPVPYSWYKKYQVRKYGFHGMSHKYVSIKAAEFIHKPLENTAFITAHLGNGCSACSILHGKSIDTTMGLTPLEGLVMGTRSGSVDPSLIFYMADKLNIEPKDSFNYLNKSSGLLGVSELTFDCRDIEDAMEQGNKQAKLAIDLFCYILAKNIASLSVALGRLDALIFTGGIGENANIIREKTVNLLSIFNLKLDHEKNNNTIRGKAGSIAQLGGSNDAEILVIPTNEELMIAKDVLKIVKK